MIGWNQVKYHRFKVDIDYFLVALMDMVGG